MSLLETRVRRAISSYGEPFTVGAFSRRGLFSVILTGALNGLFPRYVADAMVRPVWEVFVLSDDPTTVGQTLSFRGQPHAVRGVWPQKLGDGTVAKRLVVEPI